MPRNLSNPANAARAAGPGVPRDALADGAAPATPADDPARGNEQADALHPDGQRIDRPRGDIAHSRRRRTLRSLRRRRNAKRNLDRT
jgi:hypothetical protein